AECGRGEDHGGSATRSGWRVPAGPQRDQLRTGAVADCDDAHGLDKHLGRGRARYDFLLTELADIICLAGDSSAFLRRELVELDAPDKGGTQNRFGGRVESDVSGRDSRPADRGSAGCSAECTAGHNAGHRVQPAGGARGSIASTGVWHTCRVDAECFRTAAAGGSRRVLQSAGLWFQPEHRWLGRNDRHRTAAQSPVFVERKAVSRKGAWRTVRRNWTKRVVQR